MDIETDPTPQNAGPVEPPANPEQRAALERGYETTDVGTRGLVIFTASLVVFLVVVFIGVAVLFRGYGIMNKYLDRRRAADEPGAASLVRAEPDYRGPLLQIVPEHDLDKMRADDASALAGYGWIDRQKGIVRLPVDRAMEILAQRGLPPVGAGVTPEQMQAQRVDPQVEGQALRP